MEQISYTHKKSKRARRMRLAVYGDGSVVVTSPYWLPISRVECFISLKRSWLLKKIQYFKSRGVSANAPRKFTRKDYLAHKERARVLAEERLAYFNKVYGFTFNKIFIRNQKSRWGSCSSKGNLNFNYKIALLPPYMADYIIVHELCHLGQFNHSREFWNLVARTVPNYLEIRKELKKSAMSLS